jgi:hypothetical protein
MGVSDLLASVQSMREELQAKRAALRPAAASDNQHSSTL